MAIAAGATFIGMFILMPFLIKLGEQCGLYTVVHERECKVYMLFGKPVAVLSEPGRCLVLDMRLDQEYLRSQPVNSEEGAPMGIGIWYEMFVGDPESYLFKNADPRGSLAANVSNATVRCLSNMKLADMLENRHAMSQTVRAEVSPKSQEWGYHLGSVYIRKVHFRDAGMVRQIEGKVVNRLRQVTSAIKQDGANQVSVITSTAERQAAVEFAKAAAMRPRIVGAALERISQDPEITRAMFEILETQNILEGKAELTLVPKGSGMLTDIVAANPGEQKPVSPPVIQ
jgi:hypothetical protein